MENLTYFSKRQKVFFFHKTLASLGGNQIYNHMHCFSTIAKFQNKVSGKV